MSTVESCQTNNSQLELHVVAAAFGNLTSMMKERGQRDRAHDHVADVTQSISEIGELGDVDALAGWRLVDNNGVSDWSRRALQDDFL